jgi:hypothetical protein
MDGGWIKIYRSVQTHWLWDDSRYLKAWITLLMVVNYEEKKVLIDKVKYVCKRGQSMLSLDSWVKEFGDGWTKDKVRTFLRLLKEDGMITTTALRRTTLLTVCKYEEYQDNSALDPTQNQPQSLPQNPSQSPSQSLPQNPSQSPSHSPPTKEGEEIQERKEEEKKSRKKTSAPVFSPPTLDEVKEYFSQNGYTVAAAIKAYNFYNVASWVDSKGNKVRNWKQRMISVWFQPENKIQIRKMVY